MTPEQEEYWRQARLEVWQRAIEFGLISGEEEDWCYEVLLQRTNRVLVARWQAMSEAEREAIRAQNAERDRNDPLLQKFGDLGTTQTYRRYFVV